MRKLLWLSVIVFLSISILSCSKDDSSKGDSNKDKEVGERLCEIIKIINGKEIQKSIIVYDGERVSKVQIQKKDGAVWRNDSEVKYTYKKSLVSEIKLGGYKKEYLFENNKVTKIKDYESDGSDWKLISSVDYLYGDDKNLRHIFEEGKHTSIFYDLDNRFERFSSPFGSVVKGLELRGVPTFDGDKIKCLTVSVKMGGKDVVFEKSDFYYSNDLLIRESILSADDDTNLVDSKAVVHEYKYDENACLVECRVFEGEREDFVLKYKYEEGKGNMSALKYSPYELLLKKYTGGCIK